MAVTSFRRLVQACLVPGVQQRGVRVMVPLHAVTALRDRPRPPLQRLPARETAVLRAGVAAPAGDADRDWTGFSAVLPPEALLAALRGWWRCDAASVAAGQVLPVTLSGFVVAVLTGLGEWDTDSRARHRFPRARLAGYVTDLVRPAATFPASTRADRAVARLLLGARLPSQSGGPIAYVPTGTTPPPNTTDRPTPQPEER